MDSPRAGPLGLPAEFQQLRLLATFLIVVT